jgi:hypothetical protein
MKDFKFKFDKFINDICSREEDGKKRVEDHAKNQENLPQRRYNELYREHWQNSTRFRSKK